MNKELSNMEAENVVCPRCEQEVSKEAIVCPFCGFGILAWLEGDVDENGDPVKQKKTKLETASNNKSNQ